MAVTAQTLSRTNMREFAFASDVVKENNIDHVYWRNPCIRWAGPRPRPAATPFW